MKPRLQKKLFNAYPEFFSQKDLSIQESCMPWGIECGDGWYRIIDEFCSFMKNCASRWTFYRGVSPLPWWKVPIRRIVKIFYKNVHKIKWLCGKTIPEPEVEERKFTFSQIKEKYGTLRLYFNTNSKTYDDMADVMSAWAEWKSENTCEECGEPGKMNDGDWLRVRCKKCWED